MLEGSSETLQEIIQRHDIQATDLQRFNADKNFKRRVDAFREEVREKGLTFRVKARAQAEELLTTSWQLIHNEDVSPSVKADLIKSTVKWAGLEIRGTEDNASGASGVSITINLGDKNNPADSRVVNAEVIDA
tara:strand:- start:1783 stop:2181 length:399 start_codon:yes stop_codon:yes gene_type:complete